MRRFTGHREPWGQFVDVKINAADLLQGEITRKKPGTVWISGVCDPFQPLEAKYRLTRKCLEILVDHDWNVVIQTRSPLVLRDMDIFRESGNVEVGFSIATADDSVRKLFEPDAPTIQDRLQALAELHRSGIRTYAMVAPLLPGAGSLPEALEGRVNYILVDRMNYHYADWVYRKYGLEGMLTDEFFFMAAQEIDRKCTEKGIECRVVF